MSGWEIVLLIIVVIALISFLSPSDRWDNTQYNKTAPSHYIIRSENSNIIEKADGTYVKVLENGEEVPLKIIEKNFDDILKKSSKDV